MQPRRCYRDLRKAGSPERAGASRPRAGRARAFTAILGAMIAACSGSARAVRLAAPPGEPEIYRITCDKRISTCRDKAHEVCAGPYEVLESAGSSVEPERVTSAPGPRSTGPRYQRPKWLGHMVVACGHTPTATTLGDAPPRSSPAPVAPALPRDRVCVPGTTQACLGPGACRGAQACSADGQGYAACDCGAPSQESTRAPDARDAGASRELP